MDVVDLATRLICSVVAISLLVHPCRSFPCSLTQIQQSTSGHGSSEGLGPLFRAALLLQHIHHCPDAVARLHDLKSRVDLGQLLAVRDELVDLESALEVVADKTRQLRTALDTAEGAALPDTTSHQLEC